MLGHRAVPIFLVDGDRPALFDAGMTFLGPDYARQIREVLHDRQPAWCFLTHSHFDHCGAVAFLKAQFPQMKVVCSVKAADVLQRPNAIRLITDLNRQAAAMAAAFGLEPPEEARFETFGVDATAGEGDCYEVSAGVDVQVLATPGHTWDFLSFYLPAKKLLIASEALGTPDESGYIVTDCLVDYDRHYQSMQRLSTLDVETLCLGHLYALTGSDARVHMQASLMQSRRFHDMVARFLDEANGDLQTVMERVKAFEWDGKTCLRQPEPAYVINLEARIRSIRNQLAKEPS